MSGPSLLCGEWVITEHGIHRRPPVDGDDVATWSGEERRSGKERRQLVERRSERARGRRYRLADRRRK